VIVSTVLLYGSDTWVVTRRMEELLTSQPMPQAHYATFHPMYRPSMILGYAVDDWSSGGSLTAEASPGHALPPAELVCYGMPVPDPSTNDASPRPDFRVLKPLSGTNQYHFKIWESRSL
jgi:hypothetical protein